MVQRTHFLHSFHIESPVKLILDELLELSLDGVDFVEGDVGEPDGNVRVRQQRDSNLKCSGKLSQGTTNVVTKQKSLGRLTEAPVANGSFPLMNVSCMGDTLVSWRYAAKKYLMALVSFMFSHSL